MSFKTRYPKERKSNRFRTRHSLKRNGNTGNRTNAIRERNSDTKGDGISQNNNFVRKIRSVNMVDKKIDILKKQLNSIVKMWKFKEKSIGLC